MANDNWASFHVITGHSDSFSRVSIQNFCPFLNCIVFLLSSGKISLCVLDVCSLYLNTHAEHISQGPEDVSSLCLPYSCPSHLCCAFVLSHFSRVWFRETLWTVTCQAPLSMEFSRQEYWNGLLCPPPGDPSVLGIKPVSCRSPALAGRFFTTNATWEAPLI